MEKREIKFFNFFLSLESIVDLIDAIYTPSAPLDTGAALVQAIRSDLLDGSDRGATQERRSGLSAPSQWLLNSRKLFENTFLIILNKIILKILDFYHRLNWQIEKSLLRGYRAIACFRILIVF